MSNLLSLSKKANELISQFGFIPKTNENTTLDHYQSMYWGKEKTPKLIAWSVDSEDILPNEINAYSNSKDVSVMGFGSTKEEAFQDALNKIHSRRIKRNWDFVMLINGLVLRNGANVQYHLGGVIKKIRK